MAPPLGRQRPLGLFPKADPPRQRAWPRLADPINSSGVSMSLSDLASLGSLVSGVAVLVSLVFLYFQVRQVNQQVRQAEENQRATIAQVRASCTAEMAMHQTDPAVATAVRKRSPPGACAS